MTQCYISVSDLAICQRCPALLAQKIHMHQKSAWLVGITGGGHAYGSLFHSNIARVFFEAASRPNSRLHGKIMRSLMGYVSLESVIRENIFMPFIAKYSGRLTAEQITALAGGVSVWVRAMSDFMRGIPSLMRNPKENMPMIFALPEQKMQGHYDCEGGRLNITGRYDALMFNPDNADARLFEFKGCMKSDITVPLSQSLIYAWLVEKLSGIMPSVGIIYLDEKDREPDVFSSSSVREMAGENLPVLFQSAFDVISRRRLQGKVQDKNLCAVCKFKSTCNKDMSLIFRNRRGSSLFTVLVFFLMVGILISQIFFYSELSVSSQNDEHKMLELQVRLEGLVDDAIGKIKAGGVSSQEGIEAAYASYSWLGQKMSSKDNYKSFYDATLSWTKTQNGATVNIHGLNYALLHERNYITGSRGGWEKIPMHERLFPPMRDHYLIRAYTPVHGGSADLMYQVLTNNNGDILSWQEVWY